MRVTSVECAVLMAPDSTWHSYNTAQDDVVVEVHTDEGITGIGEVEANPWAVKALIEGSGSHAMDLGLGELLIGRDPTQPRALWEQMYNGSLLSGRRGVGICAIGAIDMAIWDICGKSCGQPVWKLLGGARRESIIPYASLLPSAVNLRDYRESLLTKAAWARRAGFRAAKMEILIRGPFAPQGIEGSDEAIVDLVAACREAAGPDMTMMVDLGYAWRDWKTALRTIRRLERFDLYFVETPLPTDDLEGYARLADATEVRIAAGELLTTRFEFAELMERGRVDVVQPDVGRVGGITEALRVAEMAAERSKLVVPHCWKSAIGIAATAHVAAAAPNCPFIEFLPAAISESQIREELVVEELKIQNGELPLPALPGLGVEINPGALAKFSANEPRFAGNAARTRRSR